MKELYFGKKKSCEKESYREESSKRIIALTVAMLLAVVTFLAAVPLYAEAATDSMKIVAIDLLGANTGEATMISDGSGKSLLVDSGDKHNDSIFDWLNANGYKNKKFDTLVTHWHDDHAGNTAEIIRKYRVGTVYIPKTSYLDQSENKGYYAYEKTYAKDVLKAAKERGTKVVYLKKGQNISVGTVKGKVLYYCGSPYSENWYPVQFINNQSAVIMFSGGGSKLLMAGDIQAQAEKRILNEGTDVKADIFKLSHHGYDRSNTQSFIQAVDPTYSWFTCYQASPSKYSVSDVNDSVSRMGKIANVFGTRYNGTIQYTCKDGEIKVTAERNTVKMYQRLINKTSGSTRKVTYTFNKACDVHITSKVLNPDKYYNRQLNADGSVFTGSWEKKGDYYYLKNGKIYAINTFAIKNGEVYYFDYYGRRQRAFTAAYGRTYYFAPHRVRGWKTIGDGRYYFMNSYCSGYDPSKAGMMMTGFVTVSGKRYYFMDKNCNAYSYADRGKRVTGFFTIGEKKYYAINEKMEGYTSANLGVIKKGWAVICGSRYYFDTDGVMCKEWKTIGGKLYYFGTNGKMKTGFFTVGGKTYYAYEDGSLATGSVVIDGEEYIFDTLENGCALLSSGSVPEENPADGGTEAAQEDENAGMGSDIPATNEGGEDPDSGSTLGDGSTGEESATLEEPGTGGSTEEPGGSLEGEGGSTEGNTEGENLPGEGTATSGSTGEGNEPADGAVDDADGTGPAEDSALDTGSPVEDFSENDNTENEII